MLSKQEEIKMLANFVKKLGGDGDSYTGKWLREQLPFIERDILDDVMVSAPTLAEARAEAAKILEEAKAAAMRVRLAADSYHTTACENAAKVCEKERAKIDTLRSGLYEFKRRLQQIDAEVSSMGRAVVELERTATL